jgi:hypothetical protein
MEPTEAPPDASSEIAKPSSSTTSNLRWLDDLERDFDKSFVECDILLGEIDSDQSDLSTECRQKMTGISSCFAQLVCKSQTLFHKNLKLEDQVRDYKEMLTNTNALSTVAEKQAQDLMLQVHSLQESQNFLLNVLISTV